eukprot:SAG11_NODE_11296_length_770_cov_1.296572_2_plen_69_part_00
MRFGAQADHTVLVPGQTTLRLHVCGEWGDRLATPSDAAVRVVAQLGLPLPVACVWIDRLRKMITITKS